MNSVYVTGKIEIQDNLKFHQRKIKIISFASTVYEKNVRC